MGKDCTKLLEEVRKAIGEPTELETGPVEPPAPAKKTKKKIAIEEVDSEVPVEAPKKAKKKIAIEEVDSAATEAPKKKEKKKIAIEEFDGEAAVPTIPAH